MGGRGEGGETGLRIKGDGEGGEGYVEGRRGGGWGGGECEREREAWLAPARRRFGPPERLNSTRRVLGRKPPIESRFRSDQPILDWCALDKSARLCPYSACLVSLARALSANGMLLVLFAISVTNALGLVETTRCA